MTLALPICRRPTSCSPPESHWNKPSGSRWIIERWQGEEQEDGKAEALHRFRVALLLYALLFLQLLQRSGGLCQLDDATAHRAIRRRTDYRHYHGCDGLRRPRLRKL